MIAATITSGQPVSAALAASAAIPTVPMVKAFGNVPCSECQITVPTT